MLPHKSVQLPIDLNLAGQGQSELTKVAPAISVVLDRPAQLLLLACGIVESR